MEEKEVVKKEAVALTKEETQISEKCFEIICKKQEEVKDLLYRTPHWICLHILENLKLDMACEASIEIHEEVKAEEENELTN